MIGRNQDNATKLVFLNIKDGKILRKNGLTYDEYDFVEGNLTNIFTKERVFNGETLLYWYMLLKDKDSTYCIGFPYSSGVFKSIILSIAGEENIVIAPLRLETYFKNGHTKVIVSLYGKKCDWITKELPPIVETKVGGRIIRDDTNRMSYICSLVEKINSRL